MVHHERAARALERLGILCYDVAKPMKECGCQETVFTNSLVGTKTGGRPLQGLLPGGIHWARTNDLHDVQPFRTVFKYHCTLPEVCTIHSALLAFIDSGIGQHETSRQRFSHEAVAGV